MDLTFFTAAHMVPCFGYVTKTNVLAIAEQCLHSIKSFSDPVSYSVLTVSRLEAGKRLGEDTARTADPN